MTARDDGRGTGTGPSGAAVRVVVVDDQEMVRAGFAALLGADPGIAVVGVAADGAAAVELVRTARPDVVLMDVRMPVLDGIEAARAILAEHPAGRCGSAPGGSSAPGRAGPRIIMLTTFDVDDYVYESLRAGASGFLLKDASAAELVAAVRVVAGGEALLAPAVTSRVIEHFAANARRAPREDPRVASLTDREREVLLRVAAGRSNGEIAGDLFLAEQTVKSHVSRIFAKLDLRDRVQAVVLAYESGMVSPAGR